MKIGLVVPYLRNKQGGEHETLVVAKGLKDAGHDVKVYTYAANPEECFPELFRQVDVKPVAWAAKLRDEVRKHKPLLMLAKLIQPYYEWWIMFKLSKIIDKDREILCVTNYPAEWAASLAAKRLGIPWVWICNEPPFYCDERIPKSLFSRVFHWPVYSAWDKYCVKSVSAVFSLSKTGKPFIDKTYAVDSIVSHLPYIPGTKIEFPRTDAKGKVRSMYVAPLASYKRPMDAIEALVYCPTAELKMIGDGVLRQDLEALAKKLGVSERVKFLGRVSDEVLAKCYADSDVMICTAEQTWGLVAIDAVARGLLVISSTETGVSEIFEDGKNGFVVPPRNPKAIGEKLVWIANNRKKAREMAEKAKALLKDLTLENYIKRLEAEFMRCLKQRHNAKQHARKH